MSKDHTLYHLHTFPASVFTFPLTSGNRIFGASFSFAESRKSDDGTFFIGPSETTI